MLDETIRCCSLLDTFVSRYRQKMAMELTRLGDRYVLELRGVLHIEGPSPSTGDSSCGTGCISCGPQRKEKPEEAWQTVPFETVWRVCPFCGGGFVREGT